MVFSSYFGNVNNLFKKGFKKEDLVRISVYKCKWLPDVDFCEELFVKKNWLWEYKSGLMEWEEYKYKYFDYLYSEVDMKFWWNFEKKFNGKVLLCFEKNSKFCHRGLVKIFYKWLMGKDIIKEIKEI